MGTFYFTLILPTISIIITISLYVQGEIDMQTAIIAALIAAGGALLGNILTSIITTRFGQKGIKDKLDDVREEIIREDKEAGKSNYKELSKEHDRLFYHVDGIDKFLRNKETKRVKEYKTLTSKQKHLLESVKTLQSFS